MHRVAQRLLPRTLLWQTFLLVALLLTLALAAWSQIFRYFEEGPRARDLAQMVVSVVNLTRTALINGDAARRRELLIELAALEGIRVYPAESTDEIVPLQDTRPMRLLVAEVRRNLGEHTRFASRWKTLDGFWISFRLDPDDQDEYWAMLPQDRIAKPHALEWLSWGGAALMAALLGAYLIVSRIGAPLRQMARAARMVGNGQTPPPLAESGPQEIAIVARAFNQMAGDLARTDADRALILAGVSHDLRTPLARLRLGVEMSGAPDGEVTAMVTDIEEMDRIIGQFLDFGRGAPQEPLQETDLSALVAELAEPYRLRGLPLELSLPARLEAPVRRLSLRRALANLIDNALRYAGETQSIDISAFVDDDDACIEVADRGPGIPEDQIERMRHPFTRMEGARSNTKGAGLGLAIVERIVKSHGGHLDLLPRPEGGLRAILRVPLTAASSSRVRMPAVKAGAHHQ
ncbi:HAMP domain-containing protein [Azoarcus sp. L1K30]|uniref:sensor histidine kinase n=1 Tax=Azoarcus sp. L1K30 TaxID=2820277 RepID=UPI001B81AA60|nr:sensor histidine kinase [Azoarcus sp. L1K30]MBR0565291.1 HAMP domain-containing protein [Azoarcus sp. L1K30]